MASKKWKIQLEKINWIRLRGQRLSNARIRKTGGLTSHMILDTFKQI